MSRVIRSWIAAAAATAIGLSPQRVLAQLDYTTYRFADGSFTGVTGIRGDNMTGNYAIPGGGGPTGGLLFSSASDAARIDFGVTYGVGARTSLYANGSAELSNRGQALAGTAGVRIVW
jgi:hypothetical protein